MDGFLNGYMVKFAEPQEYKRTWKERLFSLPWRPWVKYMYEEFVPDGQVLVCEIPDYRVHRFIPSGYSTQPESTQKYLLMNVKTYKEYERAVKDGKKFEYPTI